MNKLKQLDNKDDFARLLGFKNSSYINYILYNIGTDNLYRVFSIPKKNGEVRLIHAPKPELKLLQKKLANVLWDCFVDDLSSKSKEKKQLLVIFGRSNLTIEKCTEALIVRVHDVDQKRKSQ